MRRKLNVVIVSCLLLIFLVSGCRNKSVFKKKKQQDSIKIATKHYNNSNIFIQTASFGELRESKRHSGYYLLTLYGASPYITYVAKRPSRKSGLISLRKFVKTWSTGSNNFNINNPNAIVTAGKINDATNKNTPPLIIRLTAIKYNAAKNALIFLAKPLASERLIYKDITYQYVNIIIS